MGNVTSSLESKSFFFGICDEFGDDTEDFSGLNFSELPPLLPFLAARWRKGDENLGRFGEGFLERKVYFEGLQENFGGQYHWGNVTNV